MQDLNLTPTRRSFIKSAGIALVGAAALGAAGCAPKAKGETGLSAAGNDAAQAIADISWDGEYDVIVVGGGIAGLSTAATVALEGDGKSCLLLEKSANCSGNSFASSGFCMHAEDADAIYETYISGLCGDTNCTPEDVLRAYAQGITENVQWVKDLGGEPYMSVKPLGWASEEMRNTQIPEYPEIPGAELQGAFMFDGGEAGDGPTHIAVFLQNYVRDHADIIDYKLSTPMTALVQDPATGTILGVVADDGGNKYYRARGGVVMCTGGFENDAEYLEQYMGMQGVTPAAALENTADGHRACQKAGAALWHMHGGACFWLAPRNLDNTQFTQTQQTGLTKEFGITVGVNGRRFYNDWDACAAGDVQPIGSNLTTNVGYRHGQTQWGGRWIHLQLPPKAWFVFDANGLAAGALPEGLTDDPVADGWAHSAATIEELAAQIEVPADELSKTVAQWNEFCERGEDMAFYRPSNHMTPVASGPFYAMLCTPTLLNTDGGPVHDAESRILDPYGDPIPNLYSAGEFGSIWGAMYQGTGNIGECCVFGRIAARNAMASA
ncbi:FAD-dependent oxidoreductase [Adlercreutzia muris]|uniref:FAD-dependent oxidoreductase n=1 Tax=Adlercreutzia muris TaxID=1796610 RepID=UPI003512A49E